MDASEDEGRDARRIPHSDWVALIGDILRGLGLRSADADVAADVLAAADLMGIESHGAAMLPLYADQIASGGAVARPEIEIVHDHAAVALIDAGAGFGHAPSMMAVEMAADRAAKFGLAAISIRNSNHYGAAGVYARRLAERGLVGISTSSVWRAAIVPTGGNTAMLGTNPIAFAAPLSDGPPFLLDMATSTAAIGKLKLAARAGTPLPDGWALTPEGQPEHDAEAALARVLLSPLGGHKGYGLATMVEILSSTLSGAAQTPLRGTPGRGHDVGHFVLALDPALLRGSQRAFEDDLSDMVAALRATVPADPATPVLVAGDPEYAREADRLAHGIPMPPKLDAQLRDLTERLGMPTVQDAVSTP
ncbi:LDH2 family malate/lactate/ureidoglycolate dehydrogenase [Palleronia aestuarii]|uniref:LDH2 family malate/lactate/ureidoglycolate dehydrogenase n=1 Tax=Palleronia aestuarii TaxID=568105 RepID=A0A2W7MYK8_9RHOB|nr:Ldh family oxidoreductase [Palleronia aestuarii]PZX11217.1 LDH2 family malate/lactate/ureidoglycolate dehydrogenase [Palleronia aestuarii]